MVVRLALLFLVAGAAAMAADPTLSINGATVIYQKGDPAIVIDRNASFTVDPPPTGYMEGAQITIGLTPVHAGDTLAVSDNTLPIGNGITTATRVWPEGQVIRAQTGTISGSTFTAVGPTYTVASFTGGVGNDALVLLFGRDATTEIVLAVLRSIAYHNTDAASPTIGTRVVTVVLSDGSGTTNAATDTTAISVVNYNAPPTVTAQAIAGTEDTDVSASLSTAWSDSDSAPAAITYYTTGTPVGGEIISLDRNTGAYVFRPTTNQVGVVSFQFYVRDETSASTTSTVTMTLGSVNDAPSFTKGANVSVAQDSGLNTIAGWATAISAGPADESSQTVTFTVSNTNNTLFAVQPAVASNGTLTFTTAALKHGSCVVSVAANDTGGTANGGVATSATQTFVLTLTPVYYPPTVTATQINSVVDVPWTGSVTVSSVNDSPVYTFTVTGMSRLGELTVDGVTGAVSFQPQRAGDETVTIEVYDGYVTTASTIGIHVSDWSADRPRITSTPPIETTTAGSTWQYDVVVDPQTVLQSGILEAKVMNNAAATITKVSGNRFRVTWAIPGAGAQVYNRFGIVVWDRVNNQSDYQNIIVVVTTPVAGGG